MNKDTVLLRFFVALMGIAIISMIVYEILQDQSSESESKAIKPAILVSNIDEGVSELSTLFSAFIQNRGNFMDSLSKIKKKEDFLGNRAIRNSLKSLFPGFFEFFSFYSGVTE